MNQEVIKTTLRLLSENPEWEQRYAGYIKTLNHKHPKRFNKPKGLSVYSSVSRYKGETYDLRFDGQSVGIISSQPNDIVLYPKEKANLKYFGFSLPKEGIKWDSPKAKEFRKFFREAYVNSSNIRIKSPEHRVENRLLKEFAKRTRAEQKALCNIQPIVLNGCFFQLPTPLSASDHHPTYAKQYGGGIDILARVRRKNGESRIAVMEIKDENKSTESQSDAIEQALTYAVFLAKLLRSQSGQVWWNFFMGNDTKMRSIPSCLDIDVVTIMPNGSTEEFADKTIEVAQLDTNLHCHSLYYDEEEFSNGTFVFSGTYPQLLMQ